MYKDYSYYYMLPQEQYEQELELWFRSVTGEKLDLKQPKNFHEKVQWQKLHESTPEKTLLADKYRCREWVEKRIGKQYLIPLLGVWERFDDIDFDALPEQFVLKANHGCKYNYIVRNKAEFDRADARRKFEVWMRENFAYQYGLQMHYRDIEPRIIAEKYISNKGNDLYDYKVFCFDGKAECILFMSERSTGVKRAFYDTKWNKLRYESEFRRNDNEIPKPENLDELIELAQKLAKGFPMVRVDFYRQNDGSIYFGEMTFTPASGKGLWSYKGQNEEYGALIKLPKPYVQPARKPAVSVIVTLYASREQACSCIEALMLQTLSPMEILCMDDSVDEVLSKALQEYAQKDDRVRIISCALGASAARNTGLEEARGDFVAFVNADQMVHPEYMKDMCARIAQQRADIVICGGQAFSGAEERVTQSGANAMNALLLNKNCFDAAEIKLTELGSDPHSIYGKMFRRCYLQRIGLQFRGIRAQDDICFAVSALMQCERITIAEKAARVTVQADDEPIAYVQDLLLLAEEMGGRDCDMLWQLCLCELKRTDAEHYAMMYHALKEEGLAQLGLEQAEEKDFRSRVYYRQIRAMLDKPVIIQFD